MLSCSSNKLTPPSLASLIRMLNDRWKRAFCPNVIERLNELTELVGIPDTHHFIQSPTTTTVLRTTTILLVQRIHLCPRVSWSSYRQAERLNRSRCEWLCNWMAGGQPELRRWCVLHHPAIVHVPPTEKWPFSSTRKDRTRNICDGWTTLAELSQANRTAKALVTPSSPE